MPSKKSSTHRELPRIAAPESWTSDEALRQYVYVLLPKYFLADAARDILFYANVDNKDVEVRTETAQQFFADYADRTFITYDAPNLHHTCLNAFCDSQECQAAIWRLSREHRLWDVALLARRIEYAKRGFASKIDGTEGWLALQKKHATDQTGAWEQLRSIFVNSIRYAVSELPIFRTYWGIETSDENGVSCYGDDLPRPLTTDAYCELFYAESRYVPSNAVAPCPPPREVDYPVWYSSTAPAFRRRDLLLCGQAGPLGIGFDLQAAIVADTLNQRRERADCQWRADTASLLEHEYRNVSEQISRSHLKSGFQWDDLQRAVKCDERGYLIVDENKLRARLSEIWKLMPSYVSADFSPPLYAKSKMSLSPNDWLEYCHLDTGIDSWIRLEAIAEVRRLQQSNQLPAHSSFPKLRSSLPAGLSSLPQSEYWQVKNNTQLISLRIDNIDTVAFVCTFLSQILIRDLYPSGVPASIDRDYFTVVIEAIQRDLGDTSRKPKEIDGPAYSALKRQLCNCSADSKQVLLAEVVRAFIRLEHTDFLRRRLQTLGVGLTLSEDQCDVIYWLTLKNIFEPLLSVGHQHPVPFFRIPRSGAKDARTSIYLGSIGVESDSLRLINPSRLIHWMFDIHLCSMSQLASNNIDQQRKVSSYGWTLLNRLSSEGFSAIFASDMHGDKFYDLCVAAEVIGKENLLKDLLTTNASSVAGRIGAPVKFYERLYTDAKQLKADLMTAIAFELVREGVNLIAVESNGFDVLLSATDHTADGFRPLVARAAQRVLNGAFPQGFVTEQLLQYLLTIRVERGQIA